MSHDHDDHKDGPQRTGEVDRRTFIQGVGTAGVFGAVGGLGLNALGVTPALAQAPQAQGTPRSAPPEIPRPAALRQGAQLDCRWPAAYREVIPQSVRLVTDLFAAWSEQNLKGLADVLHFPFAITEQTEPIVFNSAAEFLKNPPMTLAPSNMTVNHPGHFTGRIAPGSYNLFRSIDVPLFCPVGAVVSLGFERWSESGHKMLECEGIYTVTNNDGRWGIELISTIMKPVDHLGVPQLDVEIEAVRSGQDGMLEYTNRHRPQPPEQEEPFYGKRASVSFGYGPRDRAGDARRGEPTAGWEIKGVKSRLNVSEVMRGAATGGRRGTQDPDPNNPRFTRNYEFAEFAGWAGGNVGPYGDTWTSPYTPRVLDSGRHADRQKAHTMGGYIRYTPDLTMVSETRSVSIRVYRDGRWGDAGGIGQVTFHDRSNSYPPYKG